MNRRKYRTDFDSRYLSLFSIQYHSPESGQYDLPYNAVTLTFGYAYSGQIGDGHLR